MCGIQQQATLFPPEEMGGISLEDVFTAYFNCRRRKRGTYNALAFEADYERKCRMEAFLTTRYEGGELSVPFLLFRRDKKPYK